LGSSPGGESKTISPAERWLMVRERAYVRAQKRGFIGGNPFEDWLEAEQEVDADYCTDFRNTFSLKDSDDVAARVKSVLAVYGLDHLSVEAVLDQHRASMEKLAAFNHTLMDSTSQLANRQTALAEEALTEAVKTLQSVAQGRVNGDGMTKQAELAMKAVENAQSHVKALTQALVGMSPAFRRSGPTPDS
jgi:hypothetical protein